MISFRYERTGDRLGCLVSDRFIGEIDSGGGSFDAALQRLENDVGSLQALVVCVDEQAADDARLERLLASGLPVCAVLSPPVGRAALAFALRCHHRVCVAREGLRLTLADPHLPHLGEAAGISIDEALAAGLLDAAASDGSSALALARTWGTAPERSESMPFLSHGSSANRYDHAAGRIATGARAAASGLNEGFAARVLGSFLLEGLTLLGEGIPAAAIEEAAMAAGFAAGPLSALDAIGLAPIDAAIHGTEGTHHHGHDHGHGDHACTHHHHHHDHDHDHDHDHAHDHAHGHAHGHGHDRAHRHRLPPLALPEPAIHVVEKMAHGFRRTGRAIGAGFYQYSDDEPAALWSGLSAFRRRAGSAATTAQIRERLVFAMAAEARRSLGELPPRTGDIVSLYACGFPLSTRGAVSFGAGADAQAFEERCDALAASLGERFRLPLA